MNDSKFLGVCIVLAAVIISVTFVGIRFIGTAPGRYQFQISNPPGVILILDTQTGEVRR